MVDDNALALLTKPYLPEIAAKLLGIPLKLVSELKDWIATLP